MSNRLIDLLALCHVPRWTIVSTTRTQSVGEHSYRVAVIARELADLLGVRLLESGLWYALWHDGPESYSGDIPGPFKRVVGRDTVVDAEVEVCPWLTHQVQPDSVEKDLVKIADLVEGYTFIRMYGIGMHSFWVSRCILEGLEKYCTGIGVNYSIVTQLVHDILSEAGRH